MEEQQSLWDEPISLTAGLYDRASGSRPMGVSNSPLDGHPVDDIHSSRLEDVSYPFLSPPAGTLGMVRNTDPDTSREAAKRTLSRISQTKLRVIAVLQDRGPLTDEQIATYTGLKENSASKRRGELVTSGHVVFAGYTSTTSTGSQAKVWRLV